MRWFRYGCLSCLFSALAMAADPPLRVGFFHLPPHGMRGNGPPRGAALAYFELIAKEMQVQPVFLERPLLRLVKTNDVDLVLYLGQQAERNSYLKYASQPLFWIQGSITVRKDSGIGPIRSVNDLLPLQLGVWNEGFRSPLMRDFRLKYETMGGADVTRRHLLKVKFGRIQAYYSPDSSSIEHEITQQQLADDLMQWLLPEPPVGLYSAFTRQGAVWLPAYERALQKVQKQISYADFLRQYTQQPALQRGELPNVSHP
ncbi:substrate-binding periplasmic protein [Deefgea rivuli]|uniref:substrate-binding periplasmic protein n=1 Tax=Deefgea rivuli TaxID=400948 RepID=UPI0004850B05|nr:transporter substrate-binding domain-containing protein [Deefgea rivuli]